MKSSRVTDDRPPKVVGIVPTKELEKNRSLNSLGKEPKDDGRVPVKKLTSKNAPIKFVSRPREEGRLPTNLLLLSCNEVSEVNKPKEEGMDLERELKFISNPTNDDNPPSEDGSDPVSENPVNVIVVTKDDVQATPVNPVVHKPVGTEPVQTQLDILVLAVKAATKSHIMVF